MSSCVADLDSILQSMLTLKAPGVTGGKVNSITALCNANIQSETVLIQRVYTHFKKAPVTHKLGVLYVVDSVTRGWVEQARKAGQTVGPSAPDGTFAAGVNRVTELLPSFMSDIITNAPEEQKARVVKLLDIWERGGTFPAALLAGFKQKLNPPTSNDPRSTTPTLSPPRDFIPLTGINGNAATGGAPAQDTSQILKALAEMAKTNTAATGTPSQPSSSNVPNLQNAFAQSIPSFVSSASTVPSATQAVNYPGPANGANALAGFMSSVPNFGQNMQSMANANAQNNMQANPIMPQQNPNQALLQQQVQLLQALQAQGVPQDQWAPLLAVLMNAGGAGAAQPAPQQNGGFGRDDPSRDRNGYSDPYSLRSPSGRYRDRSRSRSPGGYRRRDASPPRRRDSPVYGSYGRGDSRRQGGGNSRNEYRQRSPQDRYSRSDSPPRNGQTLPPPGPKMIEHDQSLPPNHIKVLSRTLFVGGVTSSEDVLRKIFSAFGLVQTCIVNVDKRHAFVKMLNRKDAQQAKDGMERYKSTDMQLRTRWGVGFGPRDCSNYQTGISIIPIDRLTDADNKWMLTAEYGGTGGVQIEPGMVVEEPDIEIGAGVSSKAISRRMQTDKGGHQGPRSSRDGPTNESSSQQYYVKQEQGHRDGNTMGVNPAVPAFGVAPNGFQFPGLPNGFQFPPGFPMPTSTPSQPPPPGAS